MYSGYKSYVYRCQSTHRRAQYNLEPKSAKTRGGRTELPTADKRAHSVHSTRQTPQKIAPSRPSTPKTRHIEETSASFRGRNVFRRTNRPNSQPHKTKRQTINTYVAQRQEVQAISVRLSIRLFAWCCRSPAVAKNPEPGGSDVTTCIDHSTTAAGILRPR